MHHISQGSGARVNVCHTVPHYILSAWCPPRWLNFLLSSIFPCIEFKPGSYSINTENTEQWFAGKTSQQCRPYLNNLRLFNLVDSTQCNSERIFITEQATTHDVDFDFVVFCFFLQFSTRPTLYIGEHAGGLYALPSLIEEGSPLVEVNIQLFVANNSNIYWFLGCFHSDTIMVPLQGLKIICLFRKRPNNRSDHVTISVRQNRNVVSNDADFEYL